jgi:hypothetical protein
MIGAHRLHSDHYGRHRDCGRFVLCPGSPVLRIVYGAAAPTDAISVALARHWGLLIFCVGALIIYAAYHPTARAPAMVFAAVEKIGLGVGVLCTSSGAHPVAAAIAVGDTLIALVYVLYLVGFLALDV